MYSVYFDWHPLAEPRLWHPLNLPALSEGEAIAAARAMQRALPQHAWGWGPTNRDGVWEVC